MNQRPGIKHGHIKLQFSNDWIKKDYVLIAPEGITCEVISNPTRKWYNLLLQCISFGYYKAPWEYIVTVIEPKQYDKATKLNI